MNKGINLDEFEICLFDDTNIEGCRLIIASVDFGKLGHNAIMQLVWELNARYIGYGYLNAKFLLPSMTNGLPGTVFPFYKYGDTIFLPISQQILQTDSSMFVKKFMHWVEKNKFKELHIFGGLQMMTRLETEQLHLYSRAYLKSNMKVHKEFILDGFGMGGSGMMLFITSDFMDMISSLIYLYCETSIDNIKNVPKAVKILLEHFDFNIDYEKWLMKFNTDMESMPEILKSEEEDEEEGFVDLRSQDFA